MRLYEYEGKDLFLKKGIAIPRSVKVNSELDILQATKNIGYPCMLKAQVLYGGRSKSGLIKIVQHDEQALQNAKELYSRLHKENIILVEEYVEVEHEAYIGIMVDDVNGVPVLVISKSGGVEIENLVSSSVAGIVKLVLPIGYRAERYQILEIAKQAGFYGMTLNKITDMAWRLYDLFFAFECELAEINPVLVNDKTDTVIAGDAKVIIDDYAFFRQPELNTVRQMRDQQENDEKIIYLHLDGDIGIIGFGASQTMMVMDTINIMGGRPANFTDIVGGASKQNLKDVSLRVMLDSLNKPDIRAIFATFTLVAHPLRDAVEALTEAMNEINPKVPVIASFRAAGAALISMSKQQAIDTLQANNIIYCDELEVAIKMIVKYSQDSTGG